MPLMKNLKPEESCKLDIEQVVITNVGNGPIKLMIQSATDDNYTTVLMKLCQQYGFTFISKVIEDLRKSL